MSQHKEKSRSGPYIRACQAAAVFLVTVLALVGVLSLVLPKPTVSQYEKRELASFPALSARALWSGEWMRDFESYYADTFPGRDVFIAAAAVLDDEKGVRGREEVKIYHTNQGGQDGPASTASPPLPSSPSSVSPSSPSSTLPPSSSQLPPVSSQESSSSESEASSSTPDDPPEVPDGYQTEGYFILGDRGMSLFGGYRPVAEEYAAILTRFADKVAGTAKVYNIVVPCSGEFYLPEKYQYLCNPQKENIAYLYSQLGAGVTGVDAYSRISQHTDEYLYFRTDHHWTALGAYYAYAAFCDAAGLKTVELDQVEKRSIPGFLGTVYGATRDPKLGENPDTVEYWITAPNGTAQLYMKGRENDPLSLFPWSESSAGGNAYGVFIYADNPLFWTHNPDLHNGRKALVLKESYGNAFAPWLFANFEDVYVIDYRHYEKSVYDFVMQNGIDTVIFINNAFAANTNFHAQRIDYLCNQLSQPQPTGETP